MQFFHKNKSQALLVGSVDNGSRGNHLSFHRQQCHQPSPTPHSPPKSAGKSLNHNSGPLQYNRYSYVDNDDYDYAYNQPDQTSHPAYAYQHQPPPTNDNPIPGLAVTSYSSLVPESTSQNFSRRPTLNLVPSAPTGPDSHSNSANPDASSPELSWTPQSLESSHQLESQPRKSRRSIFGFPSSKDSTSTASKVLGRNLSVRKKAAAQAAPPKQNPAGHIAESTLETSEEHPADSYMPLSKRYLQSNQQHFSYPSKTANRSSSHIDSQTFDHNLENRAVQRVNTDPLSSEESFYQQSQSSDSFQRKHFPEVQQPTSRNPQFQISYPTRRDSVAGYPDQTSQPPPYSPQAEPHSTARPPSQQSVVPPPSPLHQHYQTSDQGQQTPPAFRQTLQPTAAPSQSQGSMSAPEKQTGHRQPADNSSHHGQGREGLGSGQSQYPANLSQGGSFKGNHSQQSLADPERETPPPPPHTKSREEFSDAEVRVLMQKHEELQAKYLKVKKYYFEKDAQVQLLQNTVAHQRMSTSRTVLDDSEYTTRFNRLDGAINNLAFNIRKEWRSIPVWLQGVVNEDAAAVGTKEMTAVGRACLSRWLVDEIFDRHFHPGLEPNLSRHLKMIERNVRRGAKVASDEDRENHLAKLSAWRRTTLDGLGEILQNRAAEDNRLHTTKNLVEKLTACLEMHLRMPPPAGLENSVSMIVELAIGICANIPFESREIAIEYFLPGSPISNVYMKLETPLLPLTTPLGDTRGVGVSEPQSATDRIDQGPAGDKGAEPSLQSESAMLDVDRENLKDSSSSSTTHSGHTPLTSIQPKEPRKKSVFGSLMSKKPHSGPSSVPQGQPEHPRSASSLLRDRDRDRDEVEYREGDNGNSGNNGSSNAAATATTTSNNNNISNNSSGRIRFAAFVAVEVRSKGASNVIVRAPVYEFP
ncbi:hypothetical protein GX48_03882 [Paracoccidioides brasiliensis]|nr:hypothetical protein GX48_03882 [Paracoccidioides brasiliensis]